MIEKHINERVRNIMINDFKIKPEIINLLEVGEELHEKEVLMYGLTPYIIIHNINKSFDGYENMNNKEREYLKFIIVFKLACRIELNKQAPYDRQYTKEQVLFNVRKGIESMYRYKELIIKFRKTMPYYIKQFKKGEIDRNKFKSKLLPEYIAQSMYESKKEIEEKLGDEFNIGL